MQGNPDTDSHMRPSILPTVGELLAPVTATTRPTDTLRVAASHLAEDHVGALLVLSRERAVGLVSERDVIRALADGADPDEARVEEWMSDNLLTAEVDLPVPDAIERMEEHEVRHLVVTARSGSPIGIVSLRRLVASDVILPA